MNIINKNNLSLIILITVFISCNSENEKKGILVKFDNSNTIINYTDYMDSIYYIKLDNKYPLANISKAKYSNGNFYILDKAASAIVVFNKSGEYINKLEKFGRGPDEYSGITDFDINPSTNNISILDGNRKKIMEYNQKGKLINDFLIKDFVRSLISLSNGDYLFYTPDLNVGNYRRGLWKVNNKGEFTQQLLNIDKDFKFVFLRPFYFCEINDSLIGIAGEDTDNIYHISNNKVYSKYKFNVNPPMSDSYKNKSPTEINLKKINNPLYTKIAYFETENYVLTGFTNFKKNKIIIYSKKDQKIIEGSSVINNIDKVEGIPTECIFENSIVSFVDPISFIEKNAELARKLNIKSSDNYLLQIQKLK
ncbi:6-bladed beta-propeller [Formosa sp. 4Alg 33]|uniref:6-bladed beta-propeller n=1 Tax=Formosa sp. 4Alg 33 TaxID=3382189 RepID=UPI003D9C624D